jgi:hypothetical protein
MNSEHSNKVADILIENLKEAFKAIDLSVALAFTCAIFLLLHDLQGDFAREIAREGSAPKAGATQRDDSASNRADNPNPPKEQRTTIPFLGLEANLLAASLAALTLYWVFCLRAGFRSYQAKDIARRLAKEDPEIEAAVLSFPTLATASKRAKISSCVVLGLLGFSAFFFMYAPIPTNRMSIGELLVVSGMVMLLPPGYLCWRIVGVPSRPVLGQQEDR